MSDANNPAFEDLMNMAKGLEGKMADMKSRIADLEAVGEAGAGMARVTLSGTGAVKNVHLDPNLFVAQSEEDRALAEDLIAAAFNDARARLEKVMSDEMAKAAQDLGLPAGMMGGGLGGGGNPFGL